MLELFFNEHLKALLQSWRFLWVPCEQSVNLNLEVIKFKLMTFMPNLQSLLILIAGPFR